ncbi:hypothetical protein CHELA1G11_12482 [Hyphomicrobiales bacterium]|nr:hypothetical protein CHELA1G2_11823 [Hyphomicrobiales bacterium]CAH1665139.1 hypothetical protein CHELA1G11_12482 [Hyphomicrobiales bacterium]
MTSFWWALKEAVSSEIDGEQEVYGVLSTRAVSAGTV